MENLPHVAEEIIQLSDDYDCELIVVDNASIDNSYKFLSRFKTKNLSLNVDIIKNSKNMGFANAINIGFKKSSGDYVLLLNPDVKPLTGSIHILINYMISNLEVGICAPKLLNEDGSIQYSCRKFYTIKTLFYRKIPFINQSKNQTVRSHLMMDWMHDETRDVDWVLGGAILIRKKIVKNNADLFDNRFFLYFEDVDLAFNLWKRGWRVTYIPDSIMNHKHRRFSSKNLISRFKLYHLSSMIKYVHKNGLKNFKH